MIEVLLFASLKEQIKQDNIVIEKDRLFVSELKTYLKQQYELDVEDVMVAVNEEYIEEDIELTAGDKVAFIPPVSGG